MGDRTVGLNSVSVICALYMSLIMCVSRCVYVCVFVTECVCAYTCVHMCVFSAYIVEMIKPYLLGFLWANNVQNP